MMTRHAECKLIEEWFAQHDGDGEFAICPRGTPNLLVPPGRQSGHVIYTTKRKVVARAIEESVHGAGVGMVGRLGIAPDDDLDWLAHLTQDRACLFLGDLDPVDLLVFAWLQKRLGDTRIQHFGINDRYAEELQMTFPGSVRLPQAAAEVESHGLVRKVLPNLGDLLGNTCLSIFESGSKIELEGVVAASGSPASLLKPLSNDDS